MTKARVMALAEKLGVEIEEAHNGCWGEIIADPPRGWHFTATGTHGVVASYDSGEKAEAWSAILDDLRYGLKECPDGADCDTGGH